MAYVVYTPEEVQQILKDSFARAKYLCNHDSFRAAMKVLDTALQTKSPAPIQKNIDRGYAEAIYYLVDSMCSTLAQQVESALSYDYSLYNMVKYPSDYECIQEIKESVESMKLLLKVYSLCLDVKEGRKSIPFLVQKFCIEDMNIFLQFPHRKTTEGESISFIRADDLHRSRITVQKPGKWFMANSLGIEKEALEFSTLWAATAEKPPVVFFLSELTELGGLSEKNWEWVYGATSPQTGSCMIKCPEVARVYADNPVLDMAYITDSGEPLKGTVIARSIVRRDNNTYIRAYQNNHKTGALFTGFLADKGFKENRDLKGVTLKRVIDSKNSSNLIFPYLDGNSQIAISSDTSKDLFEVVSSIPSSKNRRRLEVYHGTSAGRVAKAHECEHCTSFGSQHDYGFVKKDGKPKKIMYCNHCKTSFLYSEKDGKRYSVDDFKFLWVVSSGRSSFVQSDSVDGYTQVTCTDTLRELGDYSTTIIKLEDKDGNDLIKAKKFDFMIDLLPRCMNPVTLYNGMVTDLSAATHFGSKYFKGVDPKLAFKLQYCSRYDRAARKIADELYYGNEKTGKKKLFAFFLKNGIIDQVTHDSSTQVQTVPALTISLSDGSSVSRSHDLEEGELVYTFSLTEEIKEKLWKPILSETEKLKKDLEDLFAELKAIDMVVL